MQNSRKTRWLVVCLAAAVVVGLRAVISFSEGKTLIGVIYGVLTVVFLLLAYAYRKGYLK
jgi:hypothetical protein